MTQVLRIVTAISFALGLFWVVGLLSEPLLGFDISYGTLLLLLAATSVFFLVMPAIFWPKLLVIPRDTSIVLFTTSLIVSTLIAYVCLIPLFWLLSWIPVFIFGTWSEAGIGVALLAIWLPLWWAPALGAFLAWFRIAPKKKILKG